MDSPATLCAPALRGTKSIPPIDHRVHSLDPSSSNGLINSRVLDECLQPRASEWPDKLPGGYEGGEPFVIWAACSYSHCCAAGHPFGTSAQVQACPLWTAICACRGDAVLRSPLRGCFTCGEIPMGTPLARKWAIQ